MINTYTNEEISVNVVDAIMGTGKTSAAIDYINVSSDNVKFLYVTPYLTEVQRIIDACPSKKFVQPQQQYKSKTEDLKNLLKKGMNIVTTHALFNKFDDEIIELCYAQDYILILDEVFDVIAPYYTEDGNKNVVGKYDLSDLLQNYVTVDDKYILNWREDKKDYNDNAFYDIKILCDRQSLALYSNQLLVWLFPVSVFKAFKEIYILTYMFDAQIQKYYYDFYDLHYNTLYVKYNPKSKRYTFTDNPDEQNIVTNNWIDLINIVEDYKLNKIGDTDYSLSKSWYVKNIEEETVLISLLKNHTTNFFRNKVNAKSNDIIWTTFKDYKNNIKGKGYTKGFLASNTRATNAYQNVHNVAYLMNKFVNPVIKNFIKQYGITLDEDKYAISELLQFIWRSAIRNKEPINLYIPSKRMRNLLKDWIMEQEAGVNVGFKEAI